MSEKKRSLPSKPLPLVRAELLEASGGPLGRTELVTVEAALGRVTAVPIAARTSVPHYCGAAMDGIAVRAVDTRDATEGTPASLELGTPEQSARPFTYVDTGNALPEWADAVVMIERVLGRRPGASPSDAAEPVRSLGRPRPSTVEIHAAATAWQHVRFVGEDVVAGEPLLPRGHRVRPVDVGALLAAGVATVEVRARPVVAILPTGDELIEPGDELRPGGIVEFNSRMLAAFVREWGGEPVRLPPSRDDPADLLRRIDEARASADVVCMIAGSSAGERDFTVDVLAERGRLLAHGVDVIPGRPAIVASFEAPAARARVAVGIPGYPVSATVICLELVEPLLAHLLGTSRADRTEQTAIVPFSIPSKVGNEEMIRVNVGRVGERAVLRPLGRGAGALTTVVRADGFVRVPPDVTEVRAGEEVRVELLRPLLEVEGTVLVVGAHDPCLALLEDALRGSHPGSKLAPSWVGTRAGLLAIAAGEAHVATVTSVEAEVRDLAGSLEAVGARVLHVASRAHGIAVPRGNPLGIRALADLRGRRVQHVARRDLDASIVGAFDPNLGSGSLREAFTHTAVAEAVRSGLADAALAGSPAAVGLGLDFVPLGREDFDVVLRGDFARSSLGGAFVAALRSEAFRTALGAREGYDATKTGTEKSLTDWIAGGA